MPKKAIFVKDYFIPEYNFTIPKGTESECKGKYVNVIINGEEISLHESVISDDGIFMMPYITFDDKVFNPDDKAEVVRILFDIDCEYGYGCIEMENLIITDDNKENSQ